MSVDLGGGLTVSSNGAASTSTAALTQAAWFIDPANSTGLASDKNSGASALLPLLTFKELQKRWTAAAIAYGGFNGYEPLLQDTKITYLSSPASPLADPIKLSKARYGSNNLGLTYAPAVLKSSTILAITTARGGTSGWQITSTAGFVAGDVGKNLVNTTRNTLCTIVKVAAGVADITEPLVYQTVVNPAALAPAMVAPVAGDSYNIIDACRVKLLGINLQQLAQDGNNFLREAVSFLNFSFVQTTNPFGTGSPDAIIVQGAMTGIGFNASGASFSQCLFDANLSALAAWTQTINTVVNGTTNVSNGRHYAIGGLENGITTNGSIIAVDGYCLCKGRVGDQQAPQASVIQLGLVCAYGVQDAFTTEVGTQIRMIAVNYGSYRIIGACTRYLFRAVNGGLIMPFDSTPWATFCTASFVKLLANETVPCNMLAYSQTTLLFGALFEVTIANLDNVAALAGCAVDPGTGTSVRPFASH